MCRSTQSTLLLPSPHRTDLFATTTYSPQVISTTWFVYPHHPPPRSPVSLSSGAHPPHPPGAHFSSPNPSIPSRAIHPLFHTTQHIPLASSRKHYPRIQLQLATLPHLPNLPSSFESLPRFGHYPVCNPPPAQPRTLLRNKNSPMHERAKIRKYRAAQPSPKLAKIAPLNPTQNSRKSRRATQPKIREHRAAEPNLTLATPLALTYARFSQRTPTPLPSHWRRPQPPHPPFPPCQLGRHTSFPAPLEHLLVPEILPTH